MEEEDSGLTSTAVSVFSEKLKLRVESSSCNDLLEDEESRKKLVYLCFIHWDKSSLRPEEQCDWRVFNPHDDDDVLNVTTNVVTNRLSSPAYRLKTSPDWARYLLRKGFVKPTFYPPGLPQLSGYGITVLKSRIYFIGGFRTNSRRSLSLSKEVFVFDTATNHWVLPSDPNPPPSPMLQERLHPIIMASGDKIYAFGSKSFARGKWYRRRSRTTLHRDQWAEVCDIHTGVWQYLPCRPPDRLVRLTDQVSSYAVFQRRQMLLFCVPTVATFSFDIRTGKWTAYDIPEPTSFHPTPFSSTLAVVGDAMFWHISGTVFAYDIMAHKHYSLYTFPKAQQMFSPDSHPTPSFLVHAGNGKLCLVWYEPEARKDTDTDTFFDAADDGDDDDPMLERRLVHFHTFQIQISASRELALVHCTSASLETTSNQILTVSDV